VDDQDENRSYLNDLLTTIGFTTRVAADGIEAVTIFEEWSPDLILMDLKMPNMDGFEATRVIKSRKGGPSTKIIIVSASAYDIDKAQIAKLDADGFIRKPFEEKELFQKMGRCLDINYIYEDAIPKNKKNYNNRLEKQDIEKLPNELKNSIIEAIKNAQIDKLKELIAECRDLSPEFAEKLVSLANRYEYEALLKLLEQGD
jgi:CheY-like chemotaxis protein